MITSRASADIAAVVDHYDDLDPFYRAIWGDHVHHACWVSGRESTEQAVSNLTHMVARAAGLKPTDHVCDIGCGYGASALIFAREYHAQVLGLTVSRRQFEVANALSQGTDNPQFLLCDAMNSLLPGDSFHSVVAIESSEHMPDKSRFFSEAFRLLRAGGRFVAAAWLTRDEPSAVEEKYLLEPICTEGRIPSLASAREYQAMLVAAGFVGVAFEDLSRQVRRTWNICAMRLARKLLNEPALRRQFLAREFSNRVFAKAIFRIWLAYRTGSMRYGIFSAHKPEPK